MIRFRCDESVQYLFFKYKLIMRRNCMREGSFFKVKVGGLSIKLPDELFERVWFSIVSFSFYLRNIASVFSLEIIDVSVY